MRKCTWEMLSEKTREVGRVKAEQRKRLSDNAETTQVASTGSSEVGMTLQH